MNETNWKKFSISEKVDVFKRALIGKIDAPEIPRAKQDEAKLPML